MGTDVILEVRDLVKTFPGVRALDGACLELRWGEVHALVGENGAGKSTLIHALAGAHAPDSGTILLDGQPVTFPDPHASARAGVGVVFQERSLCPNLSVAENVFADRQPTTGGWLGLVDREALHDRTAELLERFRLEIDPALEVGRLSAAMQQLVEILKAISLAPRIIVLDEPTSSLTAGETALLFENMRRLKADGMSFIYVSHHLPEVFEIAGRVTVLRDGRHVHTCATDKIDERVLVRRMVGRELADLYGAAGGEVGDECFSVEGARLGCEVRGVTLSVRKGEIVGLAGLAGAGRTELARGIFGAPPLEAGRIRLEGREVTVRSPREAIAQGIGYLTEDRKEEGLFLDMSVRANCVAANLARFTGARGLVDEEAVTSFAEECVADFAIATPDVERKVLNLSGGNQQKVLLSLWIATEPKFLIVDEPTRGVDVGARCDIYRRLREFAASGVGILMISSDLPEVLGMSDRILVMRGGVIAGEFDAREATEEGIIACAAGVAEEVASVG
ncbi:MAG: sugar ABC transporter ATP-binding protein [Planctomycetota bacterium]